MKSLNIKLWYLVHPPLDLGARNHPLACLRVSTTISCESRWIMCVLLPQPTLLLVTFMKSPPAGHGYFHGSCYCYLHFGLRGGDTVLSFILKAQEQTDPSLRLSQHRTHFAVTLSKYLPSCKNSRREVQSWEQLHSLHEWATLRA